MSREVRRSELGSRRRDLCVKSQRQSTSLKARGLTVVLQDLPLSLIDVTETNVDQPITLEERLAPAKLWDFFLAATLESEEERDGASVDVA